MQNKSNDSNNKPLTPVKPVAMDFLFIYPCPFCGRQVPLLGPSQPSMAPCDGCRQMFPVVPVDGYTMRYLKLMLNNGKAAVDPDFA